MKRLLILGFLLVSFSSQAQFWFGPKFGTQIIIPQYQSKSHSDTFKVSNKVNWHAGIAMDYSTEGHFEVHTEIVYARINNRTRAKSIFPDQSLDNKTVNHFLTAPLMARVVFMKNSRFKVFAEAGPRLSWWLGGKGSIVSDETEENATVLGQAVDYKVLFLNEELDEINPTEYENKLIVTKPNRLQYALDFGVGWLFDITPSQRVIVDAKISWAHSNMAFNDGVAFSNIENYKEDMEYRSHMLMISVSYMFGFNPALNVKGKSSSNVGGKKAKKYKR
ncbi:Outer membrane protein beta-barrel domain-containing protein [Reichenbachiella faecimaris]|uniref:Outer membrane protein beta-barrel domain-containing protein n=1 Tax=Reichenbachiella faecimaris TaxID=692418 RepID=A0A1W2G4X5_REIFA|nr:outer membrane beta-barrel protein [Reichenbachiella faecimaris]SMD31641.1 Outer membrane protein beta-barrel domain-containing protein [Reichenbachiella faecimaris]